MSKRSNYRGTGSPKPARPLLATAAAIGGAGMVLAAPGAVMLATPGVAQAAPIVSVPSKRFDQALSIFGGSAASALLNPQLFLEPSLDHQQLP